MMTLQEISDKLQDRVVKVVAEKTGLSEITIIGIKKGNHTDARISTLEKLEKYFEDNRKEYLSADEK